MVASPLGIMNEKEKPLIDDDDVGFGIRRPPLSPNQGDGVKDPIGRYIVRRDGHCSVPG